MNNDNILSEIDNIYNEINPIRKMFSKEELSAFDIFVNSQHPQIYEPESLSEKCYLLFRQASCTNDFKVTNTRTWVIENAKKISLKDFILSFMPKAQGFFEGDIDLRSVITPMVETIKESSVIYRTFLVSNALTDDGFQMLINRMLSLESKEERMSYMYKHEDLFKQLIIEYSSLSINKEKEALCFNRDEELAQLYVLKESYKQFPNLISKAEPFCRNIEKWNKYRIFLLNMPESDYDYILLGLFVFVRSYIDIYSNDWRKFRFDEQFDLMDESQRFSFLNFLNLSVEDGGSPYAEEFCDAMEQYCYENDIEPAIPLNLVNRRTAKWIRNGSKGEYVRVLNSKLKGVPKDSEKEDSILYYKLKELFDKLVELGWIDNEANKELFVYRLSGLNKPDGYVIDQKIKLKTVNKMAYVLRCLCSSSKVKFHAATLNSFFIGPKGNPTRFSQGTRITKEDIEKPNLCQKPVFWKIVRLLEDLGFCNVTDVHDGSRN